MARRLIALDQQQEEADIHGGPRQRPRHPPGFHFLDRIDEVGAILQHRPLNESLGSQPESHDGESGDRQPQMPAGEPAAPELPFRDSWPDVIEPADHPVDHGPKHGEV